MARTKDRYLSAIEKHRDRILEIHWLHEAPAARSAATKATTPPTSSPVVVSVAACPMSPRTTRSAAPQSTHAPRDSWLCCQPEAQTDRRALRLDKDDRHVAQDAPPRPRSGRWFFALTATAYNLVRIRKSWLRPDESVWSIENGARHVEKHPARAPKLVPIPANSSAINKSTLKLEFFSNLLVAGRDSRRGEMGLKKCVEEGGQWLGLLDRDHVTSAGNEPKVAWE